MKPVLLALALVFWGCAEPPPPLPPAPTFAMDRPSSAIPGDLDVAVRLDMDAARRLFGPTVGHALKLDIVDAATDAKTAELLDEALARARTVWIAFRPGLATHLTDNVIVVRGDFGGLEPTAAGFDPPIDLGAGYRIYERAPPKRRAAPSRIYARIDDWLVFVSEAEVDSAARAIERRAGDAHMDPKDKGLVSLAARTAPLVPLLAASFPTLADALDPATEIAAVADADDRGLRATLEVGFTKEVDAKASLEQLSPLIVALKDARGITGRLARGATATTQGKVLVVTVLLDPTQTAALIGCLDGGPEC